MPKTNAMLQIHLHSSKLTSNNTQWEQVGMGISEESRWIRLDLRNPESSTSIPSISTIKTGSERTSQTSNADTA